MQFKRGILSTLTLSLVLFFTGCDDDSSSGPDFTGEEVTYDLGEIGNSGVSGTATFSEIEGGSTFAVLQLEGTPQDGNHPAHIHMNSAAEGGPIVVSFENVDGATGRSETTIETTDDGNAITYDELLNYDGYINVHLSPDQLSTVVAQTDIGANALTGEQTVYDLQENASSGVSGTVTFSERMDGSTLGVIQLSGTPQDGNHPAHIHDNSASEGGPIAVSFNNVDGATGRSATQIEEKDDGTSITYDEILSYDGYVNVHLSPNDLPTVVSQGNIGSNSNVSSGGGGSIGY